MNADEIPCAVMPPWTEHENFYESLSKEVRVMSLQKLKGEGFSKQFVHNAIADLNRLSDMNISRQDLTEFFTECLYKHLDKFAVIQLHQFARLEAIAAHLVEDHNLTREQAAQVIKEVNRL